MTLLSTKLSWKPQHGGFQHKVLQIIWKVSDSNVTRRLNGLKATASLQGSPWPSGQNLNKCGDKHYVSYPFPTMMVQSWPWGSQIVNKKVTGHLLIFVLFYNLGLPLFYISSNKAPLKNYEKCSLFHLKHSYYFT